MQKAKIFDIHKGSFDDGPGIRTTIYFKGCNLRCKWCHNPESWINQRQLLFYSDKCLHCGMCADVCNYDALNARERCTACGRCADVCPHGVRQIMGEDVDLEQLLKIARGDKAFYYNDGGITCSGGECLLQIDFVETFLRALKKEGIHTAVDTACDVPKEYFQRILDCTDIFLVDIKAFTPEVHKAYTGVDNRRILENVRFLSEQKVRIWIRIPVIRGCNGNIAEMQKIADFINTLHVERVELLPYHMLGINKAQAAGYQMEKFDDITQTEINIFYKLFNREVIWE